MTAFLDQLRTIRRARGIDPRHIAEITAIAPERVKSLENVTTMEEPWLDEAILIGRALCTQGVLPLITSGNLTDLDLGPDFATDLDLYHCGARLPLTDACRIARRLGLADPEHLLFPPMEVALQLWSIVGRNERGATTGQCPICMSETDHLPTCFGHNLFGRVDARTADLPYTPRVRSRVRKRSTGAMAHGLQHLRTKVLLKTQRQMAEIIGMTGNYYSMIERCEAPLHMHHAERLAQELRVTVAQIYAPAPDADGDALARNAERRHQAFERWSQQSLEPNDGSSWKGALAVHAVPHPE